MSNEGWQRPEGVTDEDWESAKKIARIRAADEWQQLERAARGEKFTGCVRRVLIVGAILTLIRAIGWGCQAWEKLQMP